MPIDKDGVIYLKKYKINIKDICLIITTCISIITSIVMIYQSKIQKMQYESNIQEMELEKNKYENMLIENSIYLKSSYVICHVNYIEDLFYSLGEENNVKILYNDITKVFYNDKESRYLQPNDIEKNENLQEYDYVYPEVIFLKIDVASNRIVRDVKINFIEIETNNNIKERFTTFEDIKDEDFYNDGKNVNFDIGDIYPNDVILIPVVLQFSEGGYDIYDEEETNFEDHYIVYDYKESIYKKIYVPQTTICYDDFLENNKEFNIRDSNFALK